MSAMATTHDHPFAALAAAFTHGVQHASPRGRARAAARRLAAALRERRRARRARAAFDDAYEALHRVDRRVLLDVGLRPDQVTAFAQAAAWSDAHAAPARQVDP